MCEKGRKKEGDEKVLVCQKFGYKVKVSEKIKCFDPKNPCKFRLECPIYAIWKSVQ